MEKCVYSENKKGIVNVNCKNGKEQNDEEKRIQCECRFILILILVPYSMYYMVESHLKRPIKQGKPTYPFAMYYVVPLKNIRSLVGMACLSLSSMLMSSSSSSSSSPPLPCLTRSPRTHSIVCNVYTHYVCCKVVQIVEPVVNVLT